MSAEPPTALAVPRAAEVAPAVWRIRTSMPGHSFGVVNSYLLETGEGAVLIDTPWGTPSVIAELEEGIAQSGHHPEQVHTVLLTHYHEDHSGAAGWFQRQYGARVGMHELDAANLRSRFGGGEDFARALEEWLELTGPDEQSRQYARAQFRELSSYAFPVEIDLPLQDGQRLDPGGRALRVVHTPGHTPGSASFLDEGTRTLFTGDHVFDRRRTNAVARPYSVARPIASYWESSERMLALRPALVLPGHDEPIEDLAGRMDRLREVRDAKLAEVRALARGGTAWELAQRMTRRTPWDALDGNAKLAATGEVLAYLYEARDEGSVVADDRRPARWTASDAGTRRGGGR